MLEFGKLHIIGLTLVAILIFLIESSNVWFISVVIFNQCKVG